MYEYYIGLDLGFEQDYTAMSIIHRIYQIDQSKPMDRLIPRYTLVHLQRFPLKTPYPDVVDHVKIKCQKPILRSDSRLIVDKTGVGLPVIQMLRSAGLNPVPIVIHGGSNVTQNGVEFHVPKRELYSTLLVMFQSETLKIVEGLKLADEFQKELGNFSYRLDRSTGMETVETFAESTHDDLVASTAMACWYAARSESYVAHYQPWGDRSDYYHGTDGKLYFRPRRRNVQANDDDYNPLTWGLDIHAPFLQ